MRHATHCKFCKAPITVEIDDEYSKLSDPYKLIPMAVCSPCSDIRVLRRKLERKVQIVCRVFQMAGKNATDELSEKTKKSLTALTQDYASMICRWHKLEGMAWDEECVSQLMEHPERWGEILGHLWKMFRQSRREELRQMLGVVA